MKFRVLYKTLEKISKMLSELVVPVWLMALLSFQCLPHGESASFYFSKGGILKRHTEYFTDPRVSGLPPGDPSHPLHPLRRREAGTLTGVEAAPAGTVPLPLFCDFEHGMCGFSSQGDLPWKIINHLYGSVIVGIPNDHTSGSGYYAYPDVRNFFIHKDTVGELVSPTFHHAGQVCVHFAAILTRATPPLQVTVDHGGKTQKVGEASLASGHWETYSFSFPAQGHFTIHFVAKKDSSTEITGLDDIKVQTCDSEEATTIMSSPSPTIPTTTATLTTASSTPTTIATTPTTTHSIPNTTPSTITTPATTPIIRTTTPTTSSTTTSTKITTPAIKNTTSINKFTSPAKATSAPNAATKATITPTTATTTPTAIATTPTIPATTPTTAVYTTTVRTTAPNSQTNTPHTSASTPTMSAILAGHFTSFTKGQVTSSTTEVTPSPTSLLDGLWHVVLAMWKEVGTSSPGLGSSATQSPSHELGLLNKRHRLQKMSLDLKVNVEELE